MKPILPLVALLLGLASCVPPPPQKTPALDAPRPQDAGLLANPVAPQGTKAPERGFNESLLRGREFLLETGPEGPAILDTVVGPLENGALGAFVRHWLTAAARGALDPSTVDPEWAGYLQSWAEKARGEGLEGPVRVGRPVGDQELTVAVRMGPAHDWFGWVVLLPRPGGWLVTDVQITRTSWGPFDPEGSQPISSPNRR